MITKNWTLPSLEVYLLTLNRKSLIHLQSFTYLTQEKNSCLTFLCFTWAQAQLHFNHFVGFFFKKKGERVDFHLQCSKVQITLETGCVHGMRN